MQRLTYAEINQQALFITQTKHDIAQFAPQLSRDQWKYVLQLLQREKDTVRRPTEVEAVYRIIYGADRVLSESEIQMNRLRVGVDKLCSCCGQQYPATSQYFFTQDRNRDGLMYECKRCWRDLSRKRMQEYRARRKAA